MKVIIVGHSYLAKENRKSLLELGKYIDLEVISPNSSKGMIFNYNIENDIIKNKYYTINFFKKINFPFLNESIYFLKILKMSFSKTKPDIIHIENDPFHPLFLQFLFIKKIFFKQAKIVCTVKQNTYTSRGYLLDWIKDLIAKYFSKKVDQFICVNKGVKDIYKDRFNVPESKITNCTHLGVDTDIFKPMKRISKEKINIGYTGRFVAYKGVWLSLIHI